MVYYELGHLVESLCVRTVCCSLYMYELSICIVVCLSILSAVEGIIL